jgi:hypothetical protein
LISVFKRYFDIFFRRRRIDSEYLDTQNISEISNNTANVKDEVDNRKNADSIIEVLDVTHVDFVGCFGLKNKNK